VDREALDLAPIKVHARPWTIVADDGIVSELISGFFEVDHLYYIPAIDRDTFLDDMEKANIREAKYCSPLLVNAICAYRCVSNKLILCTDTRSSSSCSVLVSPNKNNGIHLRPGHSRAIFARVKEIA
jgi:hypothetical protein